MTGQNIGAGRGNQGVGHADAEFDRGCGRAHLPRFERRGPVRCQQLAAKRDNAAG